MPHPFPAMPQQQYATLTAATCVASISASAVLSAATTGNARRRPPTYRHLSMIMCVRERSAPYRYRYLWFKISRTPCNDSKLLNGTPLPQMELLPPIGVYIHGTGVRCCANTCLVCINPHGP